MAAGIAILFIVLGLASSGGTLSPTHATPLAPAGFPAQNDGLARTSEAPSPHQAIERAAVEAEPVVLARKRLARSERSQGPDSVEAAEAIDDLMVAWHDFGAPERLLEYRQVAERAVSIKKRTLGENDPRLAFTLSAYAGLLWQFEQYKAAQPLAEQALAIRRRSFGPQDPLTASSLYQVAEMRRMIGDYAGSMGFHEQALEIWKQDPEVYALSIGDSLYYLGMLRCTMGDLSGGRTLIEKALHLREQAYGPDSDEVAGNLNFLGRLLLRIDPRAEVMPLFERAQKIWQKTLSRHHPRVADSLESQGLALAAAGRIGEAAALFRRALTIRTEEFGADHYLVARSLADLARLAADTGDNIESERLFAEALRIQRRDPDARGPELARTLVESASLRLAMGSIPQSLDLALEGEALARKDFQKKSRGLTDTEALGYEATRGTGLDVAFTDLASLGSGSSKLEGSGRLAAGRVWDELIRSRAIVLDAMAARNRPHDAAADGDPGLSDVVASLPDSGTLVGYVRYEHLMPPPGGSEARYMALVMVPGEQPAIVLLGPADRIEHLIEVWRAEAGTDPRVDPGRNSEASYMQAGLLLRRAIWDPIAARIGDRRYAFIVPDGAINLVSFAALPKDGNGYLIETTPRFHYLSAERDLVIHRQASAGGTGVLALGGVDFDAAPAVTPALHRSLTPACATFDSLRFDPLSGSGREADEVESLWRLRAKVLMLTGAGAGESAFKKLAPGQRILHLATHGFFLEDRCASSLGGTRRLGLDDKVGENPLLLSGLALAGANRRGKAGDTAEDGILTAEEIGSLDLSGVEWTVLSGCETGMGHVMRGEGVLGMRRAFQVAGAGSLIMSLWSVDDGAARIWMRHLYGARLSGRSTVDSAADADYAMLEDLRRNRRSTHPYFWGAFVAAGDWH